MNYPLVEVRDYPDRVLTDRRDFHQLLLGLDGALELESAGRLVHVTRGVLTPVTSGETHHYLAPCDNRVLVLDLPESWCEALAFEGLFDGQARRLPEPLIACVPKLAAETLEREERDGAGLLLASWLQRALASGGRRARSPRLRLLELLPAMRADLAHPWRVTEMARRCHLADAVFARQFRALTGLSPHEWLVRERLVRARDWLQAGNAPLTEIAHACGFADSAHFSRSFRCRHGVSPSEWRRASAGSQSQRRQDSTSSAVQ
ncbi:helix-turn-helix domain-containing protein [Billgrantia sp. LNSP4103-1]|uniref:helix-turn-helix domain-containing protein n=1 Tax=Billgrantia sp. LNSP4103-1 TaxID=3410266 RepID=UPI00403F2D34